MAFYGIKEIFSSATNNFLSPKSSSKPPLSGTPVHGYGFPNSRHKNLLRLSSSLQDFSAYRRLDPEDGNFTPENSSNNNNSSNSTQHFTRENGGISFSKEKPSSSSSSQTSVRRKSVRIITVLVCLLLLAFVIYGLLFLYSNWAHGSARFYVVLDCGSTGTRVYVYQASINHKKTGTNLPISLKSVPEDLQFQTNPSPPSGRAYNRMETEPGFDKLVHNSSGLKHAIKPLLKWAEKQIPKHAHKTTSVFLYATAGVRRLPSTDSDWLLKNAWSILKHSSFLCKKDWIKIISGTEEAYYGWIALNYYTNVFGSTLKLETFGALDLGGSSLQVTFESRDYTNNETSLNLKIGQLNHHLSAYSLAGYGLNDAFEKSVIYLLKKNPQPNLLKGKAVIKHPCLQSGYKEKYICTQCQTEFQSNRRKILEISGKSGKAGIPVQLIGAPKWDECSALAKITVNSSEWSTKSQSQGVDCDLYPCALQSDLHLPRPTGQFYAMSGFYVVYRFFNLSSDAALDDVIEKGREFCEKTWDSAKKSVPAQPFIEQYCFRAPYIVLLLREGLHITDKQVNIGSGGITWTTGVALLEAGNAISTINNNNYLLLKMKINPYIVFGILFGSLCVVVFALSCAGNCGPQFFRRFYLPLFRHNSVSGNSVLNMSSPFNFRRWSPIISGEGRVKMPLSPVASAQNRAFGPDIQLAESSLYPSSSSVAHSFSSSSLGQAQFDSTNSFYPGPHRGQMRLQSRRSQSREDLSCSIADAHLVKV